MPVGGGGGGGGGCISRHMPPVVLTPFSDHMTIGTVSPVHVNLITPP